MFEKHLTDSPAYLRRQGGLALFHPSLPFHLTLPLSILPPLVLPTLPSSLPSSPHLFFPLISTVLTSPLFYPTFPLSLSLLPSSTLWSPPLLPCTPSTHHLALLVPQSHRSGRDKTQSTGSVTASPSPTLDPGWRLTPRLLHFRPLL